MPRGRITVAFRALLSEFGKKVSRKLNVPDDLHLFMIIALGFPAEEPVLKEVEDSLRPYREEEGTLHVPKRRPDEIVHFEIYGNRIEPQVK